MIIEIWQLSFDSDSIISKSLSSSEWLAERQTFLIEYQIYSC